MNVKSSKWRRSHNIEGINPFHRLIQRNTNDRAIIFSKKIERNNWKKKISFKVWSRFKEEAVWRQKAIRAITPNLPLRIFRLTNMNGISNGKQKISPDWTSSGEVSFDCVFFEFREHKATFITSWHCDYSRHLTIYKILFHVSKFDMTYSDLKRISFDIYFIRPFNRQFY